MLYTRRGDSGNSGLFGQKGRVPKDSLIYVALGTLDELCSLLGLCRAQFLTGTFKDEALASDLRSVQERLFIAQAELAGAKKALTEDHVKALETVTDKYEKQIEVPYGFVIPGATVASGWLDYARTLARRTERSVVRAHKDQPVSDGTRAYLNRLSSLLYAMARVKAQSGGEEENPTYR